MGRIKMSDLKFMVLIFALLTIVGCVTTIKEPIVVKPKYSLIKKCSRPARPPLKNFNPLLNKLIIDKVKMLEGLPEEHREAVNAYLSDSEATINMIVGNLLMMEQYKDGWIENSECNVNIIKELTE